MPHPETHLLRFLLVFYINFQLLQNKSNNRTQDEHRVHSSKAQQQTLDVSILNGIFCKNYLVASHRRYNFINQDRKFHDLYFRYCDLETFKLFCFL